MPILDKARVNVGVHSHSKLDLSHQHITTSNFMDLQPVLYRHMIPSEKLVVSAEAFARLAPLAVPTYGRCRLNMRAFFVPFRTVMPHFTDFVVDTVSQKFNTVANPTTGIVQSTPIIANSNFVSLFLLGGKYSTASTAADYDFENQGNYYKFTWLGRRAYKILRSLGYSVIWEDKDPTVFSALSLLSYLRVYVDWYSLSAYMDSQTYQTFLSWFRYDNPNTPLSLDANGLDLVFGYLTRVCYDGDYFTSAWDDPVAPNPGLFSSFVIPDVTNNSINSSNSSTYELVTNDPSLAGSPNSSGYKPTNGTPFVGAQFGSANTGVTYAAGVYTQYVDDSLKALTDYMKRHQLVGARAIDRYLADFGINLPADKLNRSTYLGMSSMDIQIGDVMSNANTAPSGQQSTLGDYAGQGYIKGGKTFEFQASEFGLFVICSSILPTAGYVQGYDRNNLHVTKDQFFMPDFDSLGVQAISKGELYVSPNASFASYTQSGLSDYDGVFGYTPRYAEYKVSRDQLTGDVSLPSVLAGGASWHLMRMFNDGSFNGSIANVRHSLSFCTGFDADQYSRIFNSTDPHYDKFYLIYTFNVVAHAPCKSLFDTYEFENESKQVTLDANGVKMN